MNRRRILIGLAALLLAAFGVSLLTPLFRGHPMEGDPAPDFTLPLLGHQGKERVRLSDQRGKVVVLDFWASWCAPCQHGVPLFNRAAEKFSGKALVFGVNSERHDDMVINVIASQWGIKYGTLRDEALEAQLAYQVQVFPTVIVIDTEGIVRKVYPGEPTEASLHSQISKYIK